MTEFWKFKDALIVAQSNWMWLLLALIIGIVVGWVTCVRSDDDTIGGN